MRTNQHNITVTIEGRDLGTFDTKSGFGLDSDDQKYHGGNMAPAESLGGMRDQNNGTVSRLLKVDRDLPLREFLRRNVGEGQMTVKVQYLDRHRNPVDVPDVYDGILKSFTLPDMDSESTDAARFELELSTNEH